MSTHFVFAFILQMGLYCDAFSIALSRKRLPENSQFWVSSMCQIQHRKNGRNSLILIVPHNNLTDLVDGFLECVDTPIIIVHPYKALKIPRVNSEIESAVIILPDGKIPWLYASLALLPKNPHIRVWVVFTSKVKTNRIENAFRCIWDSGFVNVVVLRHLSERVYFYRYFPFSDSSCDRNGPPVLVSRWNPGTAISEAIFRDYRITNFRNCTLSCGTFNHPPEVVVIKPGYKPILEGIVSEIIQVVSHAVGFKCYVPNPRDGLNWGYTYVNGTSYGLQGDVTKGIIDIAFANFLQSLQRWQVNDMIKAYRENCLTVVVPSGLGFTRNIWAVLTDEFSIEMWSFIFLAIACSSLFAGFISKTSRMVSLWSFSGSALYVVTTFFGKPATVYPESAAARNFFFMWFLFSMVVWIAYLAAFSSLISVPWRPKDINTLAALFKANLTVYTYPTLLVFLADDDDQSLVAQIAPRIVTTTEPLRNLLTDLAVRRDHAVLFPKMNIKFELSKMEPSDAAKVLGIVEILFQGVYSAGYRRFFKGMSQSTNRKIFKPVQMLYQAVILLLSVPVLLTESMFVSQDTNFSWIHILCNVRTEWLNCTQIIVITSSASLIRRALHACFGTPIVLLTSDMTEKVVPVNSQEEVALVLAEDDNVTWLQNSLNRLPKHPDLKITIALLFPRVDKGLFATLSNALWLEDFINGVILHIPGDSQPVSFYRYYPYLDEHCDKPGSAQLVAESQTGWALPKSVYANYALVDLKGCNVTCGVMPKTAKRVWPKPTREDITGISGYFADIVEAYVNFKCHAATTRDMRGWGDFLPNGTYYGMLGDLCTRYVDISMADFTVSLSRAKIGDLMKTYREECITAVVLKGMGGATSIWAVLISEFSPEMWLFICIAIVGTSFMTVNFQRFTAKYMPVSESCLFTTSGGALFYSFQTFVGAAPSQNIPKSNSARFILGSWFLFSMVVNIGYLAAFKSLVTVRWYPKDIETLSELVASGLKIVSHHTLLVYLGDDNHDSPEAIIARTALTNHRPWPETLEAMLKYRDRAALYTELSLREMLFQMDANKAEQFHVFKDVCVSRTMVSPMVTRRGSPLTGALDNAVQRVIESGLVDHWQRAIPLNWRQDIRAVEPFSLRNVISAFVLHAIGMVVSTIVFVLERMPMSNTSLRECINK